MQRIFAPPSGIEQFKPNGSHPSLFSFVCVPGRSLSDPPSPPPQPRDDTAPIPEGDRPRNCTPRSTSTTSPASGSGTPPSCRGRGANLGDVEGRRPVSFVVVFLCCELMVCFPRRSFVRSGKSSPQKNVEAMSKYERNVFRFIRHFPCTHFTRKKTGCFDTLQIFFAAPRSIFMTENSKKSIPRRHTFEAYKSGWEQMLVVCEEKI